MEQKYIVISLVLVVILILICIIFFHSNTNTFPVKFYYDINKQFQLYGVSMTENLIPTNTITPPSTLDVDHENFVGNLYLDKECTKVIGVIMASLEKQNYGDIEYSLVTYSIRIQPPDLRGKVDEQGRPLFKFENIDNKTPSNSIYLSANRIIQPNKTNTNVLP